MGKSLTETAKAILNKEQKTIVESNDSAPDRDAKSSNPNKATLKPKSKTSEGRFANPGANAADGEGKFQDLGPAIVDTTAGDVGSFKANDAAKKDTSGSSQSRKGTVPAEGRKSQESIKEDEAVEDNEVIAEDEDFELSEELQNFIKEKIEAGLSEEQIIAAIDENFEFISEEEAPAEGETEVVAEESEEEYQVDMSEHVEALLAGEELSEEFKEKATTIFESAVKQKVEAELLKIQEAYAETLDEQIEQIKESLESNINDYLGYVVEQWIGENEVAIESGLKSELTEDFINGLRNLFVENYIDIPEDKVSLVDELSEKVAELQTKLNEEIEANVQLTKTINEARQYEAIVEACEGLTDTEAEKLKTLSEGLTFTNPEDFAKKVSTLKESYFPSVPKTNAPLDRAEPGESLITETNSRIEAYARALGRKLPT